MKQVSPFITERDGIPVTTSRAVAEQFGKRHAEVLRAIDSLVEDLSERKIASANADSEQLNELNFEPVSPSKIGLANDGSDLNFEGANTYSERLNQSNFSSGNERKIASVENENDAENIAVIPSPTSDFATDNFLLVEYTDAQGKPRPEYLLTRDGFTLLAMGFTGTKALAFKVAYINAFNRMERLLKGGMTSEALRNIEERLQALERTAGEGRSEAVDKVAQTYLDALREAIQSGKYTIEKRFAKHDNPKKLLGLEDFGYVAIKTVLSYRIYSSYAKKPLARLALWGVLEGAGVILPKDKRSTRVNICGTKYTVIYIPSSKLFDKAEEGENAP